MHFATTNRTCIGLSIQNCDRLIFGKGDSALPNIAALVRCWRLSVCYRLCLFRTKASLSSRSHQAKKQINASCGIQKISSIMGMNSPYAPAANPTRQRGIRISANGTAKKKTSRAVPRDDPKNAPSATRQATGKNSEAINKG